MKKILVLISFLIVSAIPKLYGEWNLVSQSTPLPVPIGGTASGYFEIELLDSRLGEGTFGTHMELKFMGPSAGLSFANIKIDQRPDLQFTADPGGSPSWEAWDIGTFSSPGTRLTVRFDLVSDGSGTSGQAAKVGLLLTDFGSGISFPFDIDEVALPVKLKSFVAIAENAATNLFWETTEESGSSYFEIENSSDARNWTKLGETPAARESETLRKYFYSHTTPSIGLNYYRLKMVDTDGTHSYSKIVSREVGSNPGNAIVIYPNPSTDKVFFKDLNGSIKSIDVVNARGRSVRNQQGYSALTGLDLRGLPRGVYIIKALRDSGATSTHRVVVQ